MTQENEIHFTLTPEAESLMRALMAQGNTTLVAQLGLAFASIYLSEKTRYEGEVAAKLQLQQDVNTLVDQKSQLMRDNATLRNWQTHTAIYFARTSGNHVEKYTELESENKELTRLVKELSSDIQRLKEKEENYEEYVADLQKALSESRDEGKSFLTRIAELVTNNQELTKELAKKTCDATNLALWRDVDKPSDAELAFSHGLLSFTTDVTIEEALLELGIKDNGIIAEVIAERLRQDEKWGGEDHDDRLPLEVWVQLIQDYAGWARVMIGNGSYDKARKRFLQVAAIAIAACASIDRLRDTLNAEEWQYIKKGEEN